MVLCQAKWKWSGRGKFSYAMNLIAFQILRLLLHAHADYSSVINSRHIIPLILLDNAGRKLRPLRDGECTWITFKISWSTQTFLFWCTRFLTELSRRLTNCVKQWHYTFVSQKDVSITLYSVLSLHTGCHHIHIRSCGFRTMLNGPLLQHNPNCDPNWMVACVLCQYYIGVNIAYLLQQWEWHR